jgi:putative sporulation protein YtxC
MKRIEFVLESKQDQPSLERLAGMLNRTTVGAADAVDSIQWELLLEDGCIRCQFPLGPGPEDKKSYCENVGRVLAEYLLTEREPPLLRAIFQSRYGLKDTVETDALIAESVALLDGEPDFGDSWLGIGRERRLKKVAQRFADYLERHDRMHLDGFIRFRLGEYRKEVFEAAETAIEERQMECQYQEFIRLLKSMVEWQETRIPAVHVLHAGGHAFSLLDEDMRPLPAEGGMLTELAERTAKEEQEEESLVVSRLLAASPRQLYIHTPEPESQVIKTLIGIFGDRASLYPAMSPN